MDGPGIEKRGRPCRGGTPLKDAAEAWDGDRRKEQAAFPRFQASSPLSSEKGGLPSNLESFLQCTAPRVPLPALPKRYACWKGWSTHRESNFFFLADLWNSFDEWSAYGAGVPIVLNDRKGTVVQYYVPYLSALQLYARSTNRIFTETRRLGDDNSETSESDVRDSSSDFSSDSECDRDIGSDMSHCWQRFETSVLLNSQLDIGEFEVDSNELCQHDRPAHILFKYFEKAAPCIRVPLFDKVGELVHTYPALRFLSSVNLHPSSWISVAWYPIYRIPTGPTISDLAACFLTYHLLSASMPDVQSVQCQNKVLLPPFGLATYKFQGPVWNSAELPGDHLAISLQESADSWIKSLNVRHPDYEHFIYHRTTSRH